MSPGPRILLIAVLLARPHRLAAVLRLARVCAAVGSRATSGVDYGIASARRAGLLPVVAAVAVGCVFGAVVGLPHGIWLAPMAGCGAYAGCRRWLARRAGEHGGRELDQLALAYCWDLLAASLRGGLPVSTAVAICAAQLAGPAGQALRHTAELIALGADPVRAWAPALGHPATQELARAARRTARSGAALAGVAGDLASEVRASANDLAEARAQRAAVAVAAPLALCFLPAFLCLGVISAIVGLASRLMASW